jgi:predicted CXXCH cytochrome family protein
MRSTMAGRRFTGVAILVYVALACTLAAPLKGRPTYDGDAAYDGDARTGAAQPPDLSPTAARGFVGAASCATCHQQIHDTWKSARHSKMLQPATPASVKGDFSKTSVTLHGERFPLRTSGGAYFITASLTGKEQEHRVEYTLGSRRIQHYLTTIDKGMIVVLPPTWDVQRREWLHNMDIVRPDESHLRPVQQWNKDCVGCHVSEQDNNYRPASGEYATTWRDFGTSCERCHGPGRAHVESYSRAQNRPLAVESTIVRPTRVDPATSSMICAQCHSLRNAIDPEYQAGRDYYDHFMPRLEYEPRPGIDVAYWADGRPRRFSNDAIGLWQSGCFLRGRATCTSCHKDPHEPDIDRNPQLAATNNALCTGCHQEIGARLEAHTHHRAGSTGSSCVECHMPKTVVSLKATMRDHTIGVPAPENTVAFGIPNACTECHADRKPAWAVDALQAWWPRGRRLKLVQQAEAFTAARANRPAALDDLVAIAADASRAPLTRANAVGYLRNYADARAASALLAAAKSEHPAIRAVAISSLGQRAAAESGGDEAARGAVLAALDDRQRAVRIAALVSLINLRGQPLAAPDLERFRRVGREFARMERLYQDDAGFERDLGVVHLLGGELERAVDALQIALGLEPARPTAKFLLALARINQRRFDEARTLLMQVPSSDPYFRAAQDRLKMLPAPR